MLARITQTHISIIALGCLALVIVGVTLFQARFWIGGPKIDIADTQYTTQTGEIDLVFQVENTERVLVNGVEVVPEVGGMVRSTQWVSVGKSTIAIDLYDKYGSHKRQYLYIVYPQ